MKALVLAALALSTPLQADELTWTSAHQLTLEGQGWADVKSPFDRLPAKAEGVVRGAVWNLSRDSAGICVRFVTNSREIACRWRLTDSALAMPHMPATGVSSVDLYVRDEEGEWRWLACPRPTQVNMTATLISGLPAGTREFMLYLPLYNGVTSCEIGVSKGSKLKSGPKRPKDRELPVVFYGTSITHGGCASRPGMPHPAILGRRLDRPIINLGFSGNGTMDMELADLLGELEAAVYVIDCLPNMGSKQVSERVVPFVKRLRGHRPETPILLVEDRSFSNTFLQPSRQRHHKASRAALMAGFEALIRDDVRDLTYMYGEDLLGNEDTVDGSHPTDLGFVRQADLFFPVLNELANGVMHFEEPVLEDVEVSDHNETDDEHPFDPSGESFNDAVGIGGVVSGKFKQRFDGSRRTGQALKDSLDWLANHQDSDGKWNTDEFMEHDSASDKCDGSGQGEHDVGITGLALLAFLGDGNTTRSGPYKENVSAGIRWLRQQQDYETGLFGEELGHTYMYSHAIASLAMCEAYYFSKNPILKGTTQKAINLIARARNPYGAWRYESTPNGDQDTSVTGWMLLAMKSAEDSGLKVDLNAYESVLSWIDEATETATGRIGYDDEGTASSRVTGVNDHFPTDRTECMTAVGLLSRFFLGQDPKEDPIMEKHADLLLKSLPVWDPDGFSNDMYYWYHGSYAMFQVGDEHWEGWNRATKKALLDSQRRDGSSNGSWDPIGPWGYAGGRVYSTAIGALCLEVEWRYARLNEADPK